MDVTDKTILITGSTDGVGKLVAQQLAEAGARVLLHGRSADKGDAVLREIRQAVGRGASTGSRSGSGSGSGSRDGLEYFLGDFSSLAEVRRLAEAVLQRHRRIDILINNAGIGGGPRGVNRRETSVDGFELRFAVNYLAPFLLTQLLLPTIVDSVPARIVNVSSIGQYPIDFDNVMLERDYDGFRAYRQSKLAQILFTMSLAEQLAARQVNVTVNALHPASLMNTKLVIEAVGSAMTTVDDGAEAIRFVATSSTLDSTTGQYFDQTRLARANEQAYDAEARKRLWDLSMRLCGLTELGLSQSPSQASSQASSQSQSQTAGARGN
jgi:NAD(P)-dependent dehydrogenase (short-subunit alcohol dehydrogenase family)